MSAADSNKIELIIQMIDTMQENLDSMKELLGEVIGISATSFKLNGSKRPTNGFAVNTSGTVIEGVFDGESMIGQDGKRYPVPPNYASKSKLISGDILKLTIADTGSFVYKQIGPVERVQTLGTLKKIGNDYTVHTEAGEFRVLTASVTYFKAEPGDQITLIVPAGSKAGWAALENVIPQFTQRIEDPVPPSRPKVTMIDSSQDDMESFQIPKTLFKRS